MSVMFSQLNHSTNLDKFWELGKGQKLLYVVIINIYACKSYNYRIYNNRQTNHLA